jgi:hypothetical protein
MSLDLTEVAAQVSAMVAAIRDGRAEREQRLALALATLTGPAIDLAALKRKIEAARTTWLVAGLTDGLSDHFPPPPTPSDWTVIASDGSHIEVDRHRAARCFLINIGAVSLDYGSRPDALLASFPHLYSDENDLAVSAPGGGREQMIEGNILGAKRSVEECSRLAEMAAGLPAGRDCLALLDGTLILWGLEAYPDFVTDVLLHRGLLKCLDGLKKLNGSRRLAMASYISFPRSTDVVNVLRVSVCPSDIPDCDRDCPLDKERACEAVAGVRDRDLFIELLGEGERSALFVSPSKIVAEHYGEHRVHFFYLRAGDEIARIEVPQWVAENNELLKLAHGLVLDQCRRGHGYPVALSEAHELAVVTGADRDSFWELVDSSLIEERLPGATSAKSTSKRTRWV